MRSLIIVLSAWLLALPAWAGDPPKPEGPPTMHSSACDLAQSMASKLGFKDKLPHENAQKTCAMLVPSMNDKDKADFISCCMKRLEGDAAKAAAKEGQGI